MKTYCFVESPIGQLMLTADDEALTGLYMKAPHQLPSLAQGWRKAEEAFPIAAAITQLGEYFAGKRRVFDLPLRLDGTEFQRRVWAQLTQIPYGETCSYGELAKRVGNSNASRAVGLANGRNPISVIVPCHRVIGANGSLIGFGGGLERKQWLLSHESGAGSLFG